MLKRSEAGLDSRISDSFEEYLQWDYVDQQKHSQYVRMNRDVEGFYSWFRVDGGGL